MKIEDERVLGEKRMINAKVLGYTYIALWLIVFHRQFILKQNLVEYLDVFILTISISMVLTLSNVKKGLYLTYRTRKQQKINVTLGMIVAGCVVFAINYAMNNHNIMTSLFGSIVFIACFGLGQLVLLNYSNKKSNEDNDDE